MLCLLLHIKGPSVYNFLRTNEILPLPCPETMRRYIGMVQLTTGFDSAFFEALKFKFAGMLSRECHGLLIFDEMSVRKSVSLNAKTMTVLGLADNFSTTEDEPISTKGKRVANKLFSPSDVMKTSQDGDSMFKDGKKIEDNMATYALVFMFTSLVK